MKIPRRTGANRRPRRWASLVGAAALMTSLAACSSGPQGVVVNLYGGASGPASTRSSPTATSRPPGRYTIVGNLLPSDADGQRDQLVRRLAAQDAGMDLLGMDVTWTAEFAEAGWIRELTPEQEAAATQGHAPAADRHGDLEGQAVRHPEAHERPAALVPQVARAEPAEDVRRDDGAGPGAQGPGQALRDRLHRRPVRGLRGQHQQPDQRLRRHGRQRGQHGARRSTTRPCRR